jgi:hypothetical protein
MYPTTCSTGAEENTAALGSHEPEKLNALKYRDKSECDHANPKGKDAE